MSASSSIPVVVVSAVVTCLNWNGSAARAAEPAANLPVVTKKLAAGEPVKVVCLGDSVTGVYYHTGGRRAYPEMLGVALEMAYPQAKVTIVNAGISGNSTVDALKRLQKDVLDHKPDLVTVMFGLNDMVRVPLADYVANLKSIVEQCRAAGAEVLLCTPNGVIDTGGRPIAKLLEYCAAMQSVGQELRVEFCDCYAAYVALRERDATALRLLLSDEIHPNMDGHKLNAEAICRAISGQDVSLKSAAPLQPAIPHTLARLKAKEPIRVVAMQPYDQMIEAALQGVDPSAKVEVTPWVTKDQTLAELEAESKTIRQRPVDLVLVAVPVALTPSQSPPPEAAINSYTWVLNWSLSFGYQQWDVVGIAPSVLKADLTPEERQANDFAVRLIAAQDLSAITREDANQSSAANILEKWFLGQLKQP